MSSGWGFDDKKKRTLTPSEKTKLKDATGGRCSICGAKENYSVLCVHHIKEVSKSKYDGSSLWGEYKKPPYDRKSNLLVLCPTCHRKIHAGIISKNTQKKIAGRDKKKPKKQKKRKKRDDALMSWKGWGFR